MPGGDRTGPEGFGPMTGRRMGFCTGNVQPGFSYRNMGFGRGMGRGFGRGMGRGYGRGIGFGQGYWFYNQDNISDVPQRATLENEIKVLKDQLSFLEKQLSESQKDE